MKKEEFIEIDYILSLLNKNAQKLFNEVILARKNKMWSTTIVFSLAILDNIFNDEEYLTFVSGMDINDVKFSKDLGWLRKKRNEILHYNKLEHQTNSMILIDKDLSLDSEKAYNILIKNLINLFPNK